ncbi:MAG: prolyl oligopeptidase family serine peptidase [Pseudomonadota bacterium]
MWIGCAVAGASDIPPLYPVEAYAKLPMVMQPKLSPDGKSIAYITTAATGRKAVIAHPISGVRTDETLVMPHIDKADIADFFWANNDTLLAVYSLYAPNPYYRGLMVEQSRLIAANLEKGIYNIVKPSRDQRRKFDSYGRSSRSRISYAASQGNILDLLPNDPNHILLAIDSNIEGQVDVRKINVNTGDFSIVQNGKQDIYDWLTDSDHDVALGYSLYDDKPNLYLPKKHRDRWSFKAIYQLLSDDIRPIQIDEGNTTAVFVVGNEAGREALGRFDLTSGDFVEWVYSNKRYDIAGWIRSGTTGKIIGATYQDNVLQQVFFAKDMRLIQKSVNAALPGQTNLLFGSDHGRKLWLIKTSKPGAKSLFYSLNWSAKSMSFFADGFESIKDEHVAPVTAHTVAMRDGLEIEVYVTTPIGRGDRNLPTIMMPHGGPWVRDSARFDAWAQFFANRGYLVLQPNFRGSDGYGIAFEDLGQGQWGKAMQDDLTDSLSWAVDQGLADRDRVCIVGGSYGGYAAMMGVVKTPDQFQCAVSINGVIDLPLLWRDDTDFLFYKRFREKLGENRADLKDISPYHRAKEITKPVLLIAAKDDWRVNYKHSKKMYRRLKKLKKPVEYLELKTGGHSIDVDASRIKWFTAMGDFVDKHLRVSEGR